MQVIGLPKSGKRNVLSVLRALGHDVSRSRTVSRSGDKETQPVQKSVLCVPYCNREHQLLDHLQRL